MAAAVVLVCFETKETSLERSAVVADGCQECSYQALGIRCKFEKLVEALSLGCTVQKRLDVAGGIQKQ